MSAKIITFPLAQDGAFTPSPQEVHTPTPKGDVSPQPIQEKHPGPKLDGRRKQDAKSRAVEPNIREFTGIDGRISYRVQIRKTSAGQTANVTQTFSKLALARKWKKKKLAEIEIGGVEAYSRSETTVADALSARLSKQSHLGRSAVQQMTWLKTCTLGTVRLSDLSTESLYELAEEMLATDREPQTVAGYLTILVSSLDWAARRKFDVPIAVLREAMSIMWEDQVFARSGPVAV